MSEAVRGSLFTRSLKVLLLPVLLFYAAWFVFELSRPDLLIVGNITVDLVDGTTPTGGAVSYASVVARALGASSCVVTVAGPEADIDVLEGTELYVIPANETLTFEHTYTWWGHSRRLRVTANPNITVSRVHVPWRCRFARVVLLGPLTLHDLDAASFAAPQGFWEQLLNRRQMVGLMAQGFQRALGPDGEVLPLPEPSPQLRGGLSKRVQLFLSDVETDTWSPRDLNQVVAASERVIITQGEQGAMLLMAQTSSAGGAESGGSQASTPGSDSGRIQQWKIPAVKVPKAIDTNGAGDTFATMYMVAMMRGDPLPGSTASWGASRAVLQPQTCKPRCAPDLIAQAGGIPAIGQVERVWLAAVPLLQHMSAAVAGLAKQLAGVSRQTAWLQQIAVRMEQFSVSTSWGRSSSSRVSSAGVGVSTNVQVEGRQAVGTAAAAAADHTGSVA